MDDSLVHKRIDDLEPEQLLDYNQHGIKGADLLTPLNNLDYTAKLIRHQNENYDGSGAPHKLKGNKIPLGARILRVSIDYLQLVNGLHFKDPFSSHNAISYMTGYAGKRYDPDLLKIYQKLVEELEKTQARVQFNDELIPLDDLQANQVVSRDLLNPDGMLLISKGTELNDGMIDKLKSHAKRDGQDINVFIKYTQKDDADSQAAPKT